MLKISTYSSLILLFFCVNSETKGQSFIFNQLFQPSARLTVDYTPSMGWEKDGSHFELGRSQLNVIVPIKSKFGIKLDWQEALSLGKWRDKKWKQIGNVIGFKGHQIFWNFRPQLGYMYYQHPTNSVPTVLAQRPYLNYGLSTGIAGVHLMKKFRVFFYAFNVAFQEDARSIQRIHPSGTAVLGVAQMRSLSFYWYYGAYVNYANNSLLPTPFIGIQAKVSKKVWLNITLPVQARLGFVLNKKAQLDIVGGLSGLMSGFQDNGIATHRHSFSVLQARTGLSLQVKLGKQTRLYLEGGYVPVQQLFWSQQTWLGGRDAPYTSHAAHASVYAGFSIFYAFRKSLLSAAIDGVLVF